MRQKQENLQISTWVCLLDRRVFVFYDQNDKVRVVQTLLFVEGINTLLQTLFGTRLPTVIGGSWAFVVPIISIIHDPSLAGIPDPHAVSIYYSLNLFKYICLFFSSFWLTFV